jgi:hypothetical protein
VLVTTGAPRDQGIAQGAACGDSIRAWLAAERRRRGLLAWRELRAQAVRGPLAALRYHLVHLHERLEGLALASRTRAGDVALLWTTLRLAGLGSLCAGELEARIALPDELRALARLRRSAPDAAGFTSVELALAPFPGCLAGVNQCGVAVAVLDERGALEVPLAALAQDLLLRASGLDAGLAHLRLRARYAGGTGTLLLASADGRALQVSLTRGQCSVVESAQHSTPCPASTVRIDLARLTLRVDLGAPAQTAFEASVAEREPAPRPAA